VTLPLGLSVPHAGAHVPGELAGNCLLADAQVKPDGDVGAAVRKGASGSLSGITARLPSVSILARSSACAFADAMSHSGVVAICFRASTASFTGIVSVPVSMTTRSQSMCCSRSSVWRSGMTVSGPSASFLSLEQCSVVETAWTSRASTVWGLRVDRDRSAPIDQIHVGSVMWRKVGCWDSDRARLGQWCCHQSSGLHGDPDGAASCGS
jgi:hypothetical protein